MLNLKEIVKIYITGDSQVEALKGVSINFRKNEFVSILGPSGCGKTTLLNIIGGLDQYTTGDLVINNRSTKNFKDRDWDSYRNHSIGFVFQSYNLIPHQTVLGNVELALTLSGVSKAVRREKAKKALESVGLAGQMYKKPNQLSGGQMQRVAIARAIVNDPEIILADEPTGALDTETSIQVMEILKEIAKDRLVIMVTHNPDLANKYSTRIIKLLDGQVIDDTNPALVEQTLPIDENNTKTKENKTSMSFFTALSLSLKNLFTKKGRTILTAFAGSIGIIGIALILSLSDGFQKYISKIEEDTLSTYPISIEETSVDFNSMVVSAASSKKDEHLDSDKVYSNNIMGELLATLLKGVKKNDLASLKVYLDNNPELKEYASSIKYGYNANLNVYKSDYSDKVTQLIPYKLPDYMMSFGVATVTKMNMMMQSQPIWSEMLDNQELLESQYEVVKGKWATNYDEVVIVVSENNEISDYILYALGLQDESKLKEILDNIDNPDYKQNVDEFTLDELLNLTYKVVLDSSFYEKQDTSLWVSKKNDEEYVKKLLDEAIEVKVVGVIKKKENVKASSISGTIGYTKDLTEYIVLNNSQSEIVKEQKKAYEENKKSVLTGLEMDETIYKTTLVQLGEANLDKPTSINIYPNSFEAKEKIIEVINQYNEGKQEEEKIHYTDFIGIMMSSISVIINAITYVLIAFVAISLVVSSIMIGIITYISVLERTKEIGVLRSIGASKKDISRVFNAETMIIGFVSGALGIIVTILLDIPINLIIDSLAGIGSVAKLPIAGAIILVIISMILTLVAGLIPSRVAAKKDPVLALRSE